VGAHVLEHGEQRGDAGGKDKKSWGPRDAAGTRGGFGTCKDSVYYGVRNPFLFNRAC